MIFNRIFHSLLIVVVLFSCSRRSSTLAVAPGEKQLVEVSDMFQTGHRRFIETIETDSLLKTAWVKNASRVVMILIDIEFEDGDKEQIQQSGIVMGEDQLILTAGHGFVVEDGKIISIRVVGGPNREVPVNLLQLRYDKRREPVVDWAILKPLYFMKIESAPIHKQNAGHSDDVLILGYPGALGLNSAGIVERVSDNMVDPKVPLGIICVHQRFDRHNVIPVAGSIPVRGISGAPIFNRKGDLIGLFSSMGRRRNVVGSQYVFGMSEVPWKEIQELSKN